MRITALLALAFWASTTTALNVGDLCTGLAGVVGMFRAVTSLDSGH
jgi:hypothetical protein